MSLNQRMSYVFEADHVKLWSNIPFLPEKYEVSKSPDVPGILGSLSIIFEDIYQVLSRSWTMSLRSRIRLIEIKTQILNVILKYKISTSSLDAQAEQFVVDLPDDDEEDERSPSIRPCINGGDL